MNKTIKITLVLVSLVLSLSSCTNKEETFSIDGIQYQITSSNTRSQ